jgi:hypothetical protein
MFLHIDDTMTIEEVQDRFQECFPLLKLEFFSEGHKRFAASDKRFQYRGNRRLGQIRSNHYKGVLEIKSWYTVAKVEKQLKDLFGLYAQVFRSAPDGRWVQTSFSDDLTLKDQNDLSISP